MTHPLEPEITHHSHHHGTWELWRWRPPATTPCTESLVLLHAAASHPQAFQRLVAHAQVAGREVLAPALNGYGASELSDALDPVARHVAIAAAALAQAASPTRTLLFGHSMGGLIALLTALEAPALARLVLYDPIVTGVLDATIPKHVAGLNWDRDIIDALRDGVTRGDPQAGVARFVEGWNEVKWSDLPGATQTALVAQATSLARDAPTVSYFELAPAKLRQLTVPTTVVYGQHSPDIIGLIAHQLEAERPEVVTARALSGCGHMAPVTQSAKVATALNGALV